MKVLVVGTVMVVGLAASAGLRAAELPRQAQQMLAMTPHDFQTSASVKDDALEVSATITTEPGFQEKHGLLRIVWSDSFLRAFVDKKSGAATYQLYQKIVYFGSGSGWKDFRIANYETPDGPKSVEPINLGRMEDCSKSRLLGGCVKTESLAVPIDESLLRTIAAKYTPGIETAWHFRFKSQSGEDFDGVMAEAEAAGMLAAVADYRRQHGLVKAGA